MKKVVLAVVLMCLSFNLVQAQNRAERKKLRKEKAIKEYAETKELIESGDFAFKAYFMYPLQGGRISLIANPNFVKIKDGNTKTFLPYFGVSHRLVSYNGRGVGIELEDLEVQDYEVDFDDEKRKITVSYKVEDKYETFDTTMTITGKESVSVVVWSTNRNSISYDGKIRALTDEDFSK